MYLATNGQPWAGGFFSFVPLGTIVSAFIYQQRSKEK